VILTFLPVFPCSRAVWTVKRRAKTRRIEFVPDSHTLRRMVDLDVHIFCFELCMHCALVCSFVGIELLWEIRLIYVRTWHRKSIRLRPLLRVRNLLA